MKKIFLKDSLGMGLCLSIFIISTGQVARNAVRASEKVIISKEAESVKHARYTGRVAPAVIRKFIQAYGDVSNEKWFEAERGYVVMFNRDGIDHQVAYDRKGNLLRTIKSYSEDKLSRDIRHMIKSTYYDYDINLVQEIQAGIDPVTYIIQLTGKTELINLKICDGEMEVIQKYARSK